MFYVYYMLSFPKVSNIIQTQKKFVCPEVYSR